MPRLLSSGTLAVAPLRAAFLLGPLHADVVAADVVLVREGDLVDEDLYALANRVVVEGVVAGDLVVAANEIRITGRVDGDLAGVAGTAVIGGEVGGSVRLASGEVVADGTVGDDLLMVAGNANLDGEVGRDLLAVAGQVGLQGEVGRDVRGQFGTLRLRGRVGRNVEVAVGGRPICGPFSRLQICRDTGLVMGAGAQVGGDVAYRSSQEASVSGAAEVDGRVIRRGELPANVRVRAAERVFSLLVFLAFVVTGLVLLALLPRIGTGAVRAARSHPWRSGLLGLAVLVLLPFLAVLAAVTVVGLPVALILVALWILGLFAGPVPAVAAIGNRLVGGRGGRFGGFVLGSVVWGLLRLIPVVGAIVYGLTLLWGLGAWASGVGVDRRQAAGDEQKVSGKHRQDED